jgi:nitrate reductase (cytochrome), electron transfer subunit
MITLRSLALAAVFAIAASGLVAQTNSALRGNVPVDTETQAPRMRNYPEQPPLIPHAIEGYQVDLNGNKCLSCHARARTGESQAPMLSITHFMDREGQFLASVSPRRFFCTQCHVPQHEVKAPVENDFVDVDALLSRTNPGGPRR